MTPFELKFVEMVKDSIQLALIEMIEIYLMEMAVMDDAATVFYFNNTPSNGNYKTFNYN